MNEEPKYLIGAYILYNQIKIYSCFPPKTILHVTFYIKYIALKIRWTVDLNNYVYA